MIIKKQRYRKAKVGRLRIRTLRISAVAKTLFPDDDPLASPGDDYRRAAVFGRGDASHGSSRRNAVWRHQDCGRARGTASDTRGPQAGGSPWETGRRRRAEAARQITPVCAPPYWDILLFIAIHPP